MNTRLKPLRIASWLEGLTLLLLVLVAVPLKRLAGLPEAVTLLGPVHGGAFLTYSGMVLHALWMRWIPARSAAWLMGAAFVPFGAFAVGWVFTRRRS